MDAPQKTEWPRCPRCGERRLATCPVCGQSGTDFDEAFFPRGTFAALAAGEVEGDDVDAADDAFDQRPALFVLCPTCDEAFATEYPRRCEWCGHEFGDGWELPPAAASAPSEFNPRVAIALVALVAVVVGVIGFFAWLVAK